MVALFFLSIFQMLKNLNEMNFVGKYSDNVKKFLYLCCANKREQQRC